MCSCNLEKLKDGISMNDLVQDASLRDMLAEYKMIDKNGFKQGKVLETLQYAACINFGKLRDAFNQYGIDIEIGDIPTLAEIIEKGLDKKGILNSRNGQPVYFNAMDAIRKISFTREELMQAQCTIHLH